MTNIMSRTSRMLASYDDIMSYRLYWMNPRNQRLTLCLAHDREMVLCYRVDSHSSYLGDPHQQLSSFTKVMVIRPLLDPKMVLRAILMISLQPYGSESSAYICLFWPGSEGQAAGEFQDFPEDALHRSASASSEYAPLGVISSKTSDPVDSIDHYIDAYEVLAAGKFQIMRCIPFLISSKTSWLTTNSRYRYSGHRRK